MSPGSVTVAFLVALALALLVHGAVAARNRRETERRRQVWSTPPEEHRDGD